MLDRHLAPALLKAAATSPVVTLTGPRQSGKTTLVRRLFGDHLYLSLEAPDLRARAAEDPRGFLAQGDHLILLVNTTDPVRWKVRCTMTLKDLRRLIVTCMKISIFTFILNPFRWFKEPQHPGDY